MTMDFNHKMKCFEFDNKNVILDLNIDFDAQFIQNILGYDFFIAGGSNKIVNLYTKDGIFLAHVSDKQNSWIKKAACHPTENNKIALCTHDGNLQFVSIKFDFIYSVYRERFAFRVRKKIIIII